MSEIRSVGFCPHCGNTSPQTLIHTRSVEDTGWDTGTGEEMELEVTYFVAACDVCDHILLYSAVEQEVPDTHFTSADLTFPEAGDLDRSVPREVSAPYKEASRIKRLAPNAFAVQIRRALEALCHDRGAPERNLAQALRTLADKGEIPPTLAEMSDVLRLIGNIGAHHTSATVHPSQVYAIDNFFRAVVEYVYVAPNRLAEFRRELEGFSRDPSPNDPDAA